MKKILPVILFTAAAVLGPSTIFAQSAAQQPVSVLLTWKSATTYVPEWFTGKVMPTAKSVISASAELIDGGKIIDTSKQNVYWYLNNNFIAGGQGLRHITFKAPDVAGGIVSLRAEFPNYSKGDELKTADIPIVRPEVVINAPFPSGMFSSSPVKLTAQPYFFNTDSPSHLNFAWDVNGQTPAGAENPQSLNIKFGAMQAQSALSISLSASNPNQDYDLESASDRISLTYSP